MIFFVWICFLLLIDSSLSIISIGSISNTTLRILDVEPATIINISTDDCLCLLTSSPSFFAMNYYYTDNKCQFYSIADQNKSMILRRKVYGQLYVRFLSNQTRVSILAANKSLFTFMFNSFDSFVIYI